MGHTVMNSLLTLLEVYKNQVTLILKHPTLTMQVNCEDNTIMFCFIVNCRVHDTQVCG
jgi:hypothetical protein